MKYFAYVLLLLYVNILSAKEINWHTNDTEFGVDITISSSKINLDETLKIKLQITYPEKYKFDSNEIFKNLLWSANRIFPQWEASKQPIQSTSEKNKTTSIEYELNPVHEGTLSLSFLNINFVSHGHTKTIWTPVFSILVNPIIETYAPTPSLFALEPEFPVELSIANYNTIYDPLSMQKEAKHTREIMNQHAFPFTFLLTVIFGVLALFIWKYFRRHPDIIIPDAKNPRAKAISNLEVIYSQNFLKKGQYKQFYSDITEVIRRYIEEQFLVFITSQTSSEFFQRISMQTHFSLEFKEILQEILKQSDQVKFAHYAPSLEESELFYQQVKHLVELSN